MSGMGHRLRRNSKSVLAGLIAIAPICVAPHPVAALRRLATGRLCFTAATGWQDGAEAYRYGIVRTAWAATFTVSHSDSTRFGHSLTTIPHSGVAIFAQAIDKVGDPTLYPPRRVPLMLDDARDLGLHSENQPRPDVRVYLPNGRVARQFLTIYIYFGRSRPTRVQMLAAKSELRRLQAPCPILTQ